LIFTGEFLLFGHKDQGNVEGNSVIYGISARRMMLCFPEATSRYRDPDAGSRSSFVVMGKSEIQASGRSGYLIT
jgi:hypothetical protein